MLSRGWFPLSVSLFLSHFFILNVGLMFLLIALFVLPHFSVLDVVLTFLLSYDLSGREMWQVTLCIRFSFAPCSDRIHVAVTDMAALFPNVSVLTGHVCDKCVCRVWERELHLLQSFIPFFWGFFATFTLTLFGNCPVSHHITFFPLSQPQPLVTRQWTERKPLHFLFFDLSVNAMLDLFQGLYINIRSFVLDCEHVYIVIYTFHSTFTKESGSIFRLKILGTLYHLTVQWLFVLGFGGVLSGD